MNTCTKFFRALFCVFCGLGSWSLANATPANASVPVEIPSWWTERHLLFVLGGLISIVVAALLWGAILQRRMRSQTEIMRRRMEVEAARERHRAFLERERGRMLEAINSSMPLDQVLGMVTAFISEQMNGLCCWCVPVHGPMVGCNSTRGINPPGEGLPQTRREIRSGSGERLGFLILDGNHPTGEPMGGSELLERGASLAALAIDNRRLYEDLLHKSEYDQLTDIPNRFLLESRIATALTSAQRHKQRFALIYIDLDQFKRVNDVYGHRAGDIYLQKVAKRLTDRLRSRDTVARVGGDEFIALIPLVRDRGEAIEIAQRIESCFEAPFQIDEISLRGAASIGIAVYPEDGVEAHELKLVADAAMYASKHHSERQIKK
jgi:diguanylate cyclase (GGDEF)-like protein